MSEVEQETVEPEVPADDEADEAEEAESEEGTTAQPEPDESAGSDEAGSALTPEQLEQRAKKLERSATTWRNRVSEVLEDEAQFLVPCELCDPGIPGFHFPPEIESPRDETHLRLLEVLRSPAVPEYQHDPNKDKCDVCDGWGEVLTGSRRAGNERVACAKCLGNGYYPPPGSPRNGTIEQAGPQPLLAAVPAAAEEGDKDIFGSPRLLEDGQPNPNYGKMIQYKDPNLP